MSYVMGIFFILKNFPFVLYSGSSFLNFYPVSDSYSQTGNNIEDVLDKTQSKAQVCLQESVTLNNGCLITHIKCVQYRLKETLCSASLSLHCTPLACTAGVPQPVLHTLSLYCTPSVCIAHTLYRVLISSDFGLTIGSHKDVFTFISTGLHFGRKGLHIRIKAAKI